MFNFLGGVLRDILALYVSLVPVVSMSNGLLPGLL
jgi:hypothetical protein